MRVKTDRQQHRTAGIDTLSDLIDESRSSGLSPRLDAVIELLPKYQRARVSYSLYAAGIRTLAELCTTKRARLQRLKNIGDRSITSLEHTLTSLGLSLAEHPVKYTTKIQTPAQRVTSPVWLRAQIAQLIANCDENIAEDHERAAKECNDTMRARYEASVDCHLHWKKQLVRILTGKTTTEDLADALRSLGVQTRRT